MAKNLLIIDNEDLSATIAEIDKKAKQKNVSIVCHPLYVGLPDGNDVINSKGEIDINLVKEKFKREYGTIRFHLVASDFQLNDKHIDGVEIMRQFNAINNTIKSKRILYSSELNEIVQGYLDVYKDQGNFDKSWKSFKTLIKLEILDFKSREHIEDSIIMAISRISDQEDDFIVDELLSNPDLTFNPSIEIYEGLTFNQIADKVRKNDSQSLKFKRKLIELTIAHLANISNE